VGSIELPPNPPFRNYVAIYFCVISKRSEKSDLQKQVILSEAKDLPVQERSLTMFGTMLRIGFLTEPALGQILQSPCSFRMTERRIRNDIFLIATQSLQEGECRSCHLHQEMGV